MIYGVTWVLYLVSDILYLVGFFALLSAFKQSGAGPAKAAVALNTAFVVLDVGLDIPLRLWLIPLSNSYAAGNIQQAIASAGSAITASNEVALVATFLQFIALIIVSYLMTRTPSIGRRTGYIGVTAGIIALLFIPTFMVGSQLSGLFNIAGFALLFIWSVLAGLKLRNLSRSL